MVCSRDFFDAKFGTESHIPPAADAVLRAQQDHFRGTEFSRYLTGLRDQQSMHHQQPMHPMMMDGMTAATVPMAGTSASMLAKDFFDQQPAVAEAKTTEAREEGATAADWAQDFEAGKQGECECKHIKPQFKILVENFD